MVVVVVVVHLMLVTNRHSDHVTSLTTGRNLCYVMQPNNCCMAPPPLADCIYSQLASQLKDFIGESYTAHMALLMAASSFGLERCHSSPNCLTTVGLNSRLAVSY